MQKTSFVANFDHMKKSILFFFLLCLFGGYQAQQLLPTNVNANFQPLENNGAVLMNKTTACGPDSLLYALAKATGTPMLNINNTTSATALCQYFDCPQPITIEGATFYGYKLDATGGTTLNATVEVYIAGTDSMPTGAPLITTNIAIDTNFYLGNLTNLAKHVPFTPTTLTQPYVVVVANNSANGMGIACNDYAVGDGQTEWLSSVDISGTWMRSYSINVGGDIFDSDILIEPHVTYDITAGFTQSPSCLVFTGTGTWTNGSSPVLTNRMYSYAAFLGAESTQFTWNYGDGSATENIVDGTHAYTGMGPWNVTLTDTIFGWTTNCTDQVSASTGDLSLADFTYSSNALVTNFTDVTVGFPISYLWDFGDGNTSTQQHPTHTYAAAGTYTVCLTVSDTCGADSSCQSVTVSNCIAPTGQYTYTDNQLTVTYTDQSTDSPTSWLWDFGDGNTSTQQNPTHTYAAAGTYTVCLLVSNSCGADTVCNAITINNCTTPTAQYTYTDNLLTVTYTDQSIDSPTNWLWDFGDGNTSTQQNPTHTYAAAGTYTVCLTAYNSCGADSSCSSVTASSCITPVADFTFTDNMFTVDYTDQSTNTPTSWLWDFGDGNTSTQQNPTHTYANVGTYTVCLTATNACGSDSSCTSVAITCVSPTADFTFTENGGTVVFTDNSADNPTSWLWDLGDGNTSTQQNPTHTYTSAGAFTVCLIATNNCGTDSTCMVVNSTVGINDVNLEEIVSVYPNPASDQVQISIDPVNGSTLVSVTLKNELGQILETRKGNLETLVQLDVTGLSGGVYYVEIAFENGMVTRPIQVIK